MDIQVRKAGEVTVLDLKGRLVLGHERKLLDTASQLIASGSRYLAVNLAEVPMMDSSGIGSVVKVHSSALRAGGKVHFFSASEMVMQTLKMVRLDSLLHIHEDETTALAGFEN